jgi:serine/threonine protein kinase
MTPAYASPEQMRGEAITTATDVYLLGVLLYRLLCGHHPFPLQHLSTAERERVVCESEPEPPSAAVLRPGGPPSGSDRRAPVPEVVAAARATNAPRLVRSLRGDLDDIVLTALRREPEHRYPSVTALSEDVGRYLRRLPVAARPATLGYRASRFVRRNRAGVAAAATITVLLLALTGVSLRSASATSARSTGTSWRPAPRWRRCGRAGAALASLRPPAAPPHSTAHSTRAPPLLAPRSRGRSAPARSAASPRCRAGACPIRPLSSTAAS